jgi:hypothetical protein
MGAPGLLIFALLMFAAIFAIIGVGIVVAAIVAAAVALLVSAGIVSSSLIVGFKTGSPSKGIRLALFQICAALGAVAGLGIAAGVKLLGHFTISWTAIESLGFVCGMTMGMVVGASLGALLKITMQKLAPPNGFEVVASET